RGRENLYSATKATASVSDDAKQNCTKPYCFFCSVKQTDPSLRKALIAKIFKEMPLRDDQEHVLVLSGLWNIAMTQPDDPEFPSLGIFDCMANLINKGIKNRDWLLRDQNIYIPYYAAHVIGSYTMNKVEFAEKAVESGVIQPLMELLRGKLTWVEQRVAVRALGHLASYEATFEAVANYEDDLVRLAMKTSSNCLEIVYDKFVRREERMNYHRDLLTRGLGGAEIENRKAEEWAIQLQCWSLYLLNCFACKERSLSLVCSQEFLKDLSQMWGGLVNHASPSGVGLIRILCYSKMGRKCVAESIYVLESLCNLSRSSDDWQYMGIDCLLLLLRDADTRYKVISFATSSLVDLTELKTLRARSNIGDYIAKTLLLDYKYGKTKFKDTRVQNALEELWIMKVERRKGEKMMSEEKFQEVKVRVALTKQLGNQSFWSGKVEEAIMKYSEALDLCPLKLRKERKILHSNRAQCHLLLRDADSAIRDSTRALCLSSPPNSHSKSLWRRSQAYDMKGLAKESLVDCVKFISCCIKSAQATDGVKVPYYAARMIRKQMDAMWLFGHAQSKRVISQMENVVDSDSDDDCRNDHQNDVVMGLVTEKKSDFNLGLSTILENPSAEKGWRGSRRQLAKQRCLKLNEPHNV
ncbi:hypothetical protein RJ641_029221, partial [Dillenia turbinata]